LGAAGGDRYPSQAVSIEEVRKKERRHVANIKSQKKRNLTNAKAAERNKAVKSELKTRVRNATNTIGAEDNDEQVRLAVKRLDMAASKGVIHPNQAARRKSRLMKKVSASATA
jgi:small subunit ribosomal protein S20